MRYLLDNYPSPVYTACIEDSKVNLIVFSARPLADSEAEMEKERNENGKGHERQHDER